MSGGLRQLSGELPLATTALTTTTVYTGSFEMGTAVAARMVLTPLAVPTGTFEIGVQLEGGLDALSFVSVGTTVLLTDGTPKMIEVTPIGESIVRAKVTFFANANASAMLGMEIAAVPNPKDPDPTVVIPGFAGIGADQLAVTFSWQFALAARRGRLGTAVPFFPGLVDPERK